MMYSQYIFAIFALAAPTFAHMELSTPIPFRSKFKTDPAFTNVDYSMTSPLNSDGSNFPCKGYQSDLSDPVAGVSTATYTPGSGASFVWVGGATHGGGSCQAALSYDKGVSWKVIHSFIGSCPITSGMSFNFTVPSDAPSGSAILGVTWYNVIGNREIYMNCASVTVGKAAKVKRAESVAFSARPDLFVANLDNGCNSVEGKEVIFPNPGPDVTNQQTIKDNSGSITGTCKAVKGIGGESGSSGASSSAAPVSSAAPTAVTSGFVTSVSAPASSAASSATSAAVSPTDLTIIPVAAPTSTSVSAPLSTATPSGTPSGSLTPSADGQCGGTQTCIGNTFGSGQCCSSYGFCGSGLDHCGTGCMAAYGLCGVNGTSVKFRGIRNARVKLF